ncbi:MAG TPA: hypothetical protein VHO07_16985 [Streptosporangiaceae bacterium]|nr:hypothetical protein [Streptosporangiaceae bacterium]
MRARGFAGRSRVQHLRRRRGQHRVPLTLAESPPAYPWAAEFLLVRPGQHIAWRASDPAGLDIEAAVGLRAVRAGI